MSCGYEMDCVCVHCWLNENGCGCEDCEILGVDPTFEAECTDFKAVTSED